MRRDISCLLEHLVGLVALWVRCPSDAEGFSRLIDTVLPPLPSLSLSLS